MPNIQFEKESPFFEVVLAFLGSLSAKTAIFSYRDETSISKYMTIYLKGKVVPPIQFNPYIIYKTVKNGLLDESKYVNVMCCMLTNSAYELVKENKDESPEFEFFKHIRNASSHNNKFYFDPRNPKREAYWRDLVIDHNLKGKDNLLYGNACFDEYIGPADLLQLLKDIECKLIHTTNDD